MEKKSKADEPEPKKGNKAIIITLVVLLLLGILSILFASVVSMIGTDNNGFGSSGDVALITISGTITTEKSGSFFSEGTDSETLVKLIEKADKDPYVKAVIFEINSPGGSPVASEELAAAIKNMDKPSACYIRDVGASGAYWAASACDRIFASRLSEVGSIGVIGSYLEFAGLMDKYNVTYRRLVSGKYKDMGTPFKEMTPEEEEKIQKLIDDMRDYFVGAVADNRNMTWSEVDKLATGEIYLGLEAKEIGLIDDFGGKEEAKKYLETRLNATLEVVEMKPEGSFLDLLASASAEQSYSVGRGIGDSLTNPKVESSVVSVRT